MNGETMRLCTACDDVLPIARFQVVRRYGRACYRRHRCIECQAKWASEYNDRRRPRKQPRLVDRTPIERLKEARRKVQIRIDRAGRRMRELTARIDQLQE